MLRNSIVFLSFIGAAKPYLFGDEEAVSRGGNWSLFSLFIADFVGFRSTVAYVADRGVLTFETSLTIGYICVIEIDGR